MLELIRVTASFSRAVDHLTTVIEEVSRKDTCREASMSSEGFGHQNTALLTVSALMRQ